MKNKVMLSALLLLFLGTGCQPHSSKKDSAPNAVVAKNATHEIGKRYVAKSGLEFVFKKVVDLFPDRSNYSEFKNNLNRVTISIKIPEAYFTPSLDIKRSFTAHSIHPIYTSISKSQATYRNGFYYIEDVLSPWSEDLRIKDLTMKVYQEEELLAEFQARLTPDLIVEGVQDIGSLKMNSGTYAFNTIFFERDSILRTKGAHLSFNAQRAYFDDAQIETFPVDEAELSVFGEIGTDGGAINIQAQEADGVLKVFLRGTNGGQGLPGAPQEGKGKNGKDGQYGDFFEHCRSKPGIIEARSCRVVCSQKAISATDGDSGPVGNDGFPGMRGGHSGTLQMSIAQQSHLQVYVSAVPGAGGLGGVPSLGGQGGLGGKVLGIKSSTIESVCGVAQEGKAGNQGRPGNAGKAGAMGEQETSSVVISGLKIL